MYKADDRLLWLKATTLQILRGQQHKTEERSCHICHLPTTTTTTVEVNADVYQLLLTATTTTTRLELLLFEGKLEV